MSMLTGMVLLVAVFVVYAALTIVKAAKDFDSEFEDEE